MEKPKKPEVENPQTYGNEPPVEDPQPNKQPRQYEVDDFGVAVAHV